MKKTSEFTGKSSKMEGKYQKKKENTWETQKTKKNKKIKTKKNKINLAPINLHARKNNEETCVKGSSFSRIILTLGASCQFSGGHVLSASLHLQFVTQWIHKYQQNAREVDH